MNWRWNLRSALALCTVLVAVAASGQTPAAKPAFEVATIKPSPPIDPNKMRDEIQAGRMPRFGPHVDGAQALYVFMTLRDLIVYAYDVKPYQISGPSWLGSRGGMGIGGAPRFDIQAKLPDGASKDDAPKMLQALLEERFKLAVHRETQQRDVLALVVAKDGPKLKQSTLVPEPFNDNDPPKPGEMRVDTPDGPARITRNPDGSMVFNLGQRGKFTTKFDMQAQGMTMDSDAVTMSGFADALSRMFQSGGGKQVADMTGLKGTYQTSVEVSFADLRPPGAGMGGGSSGPGGGGAAANASPATVASDPSGVGASLNDSLKKLGLKLDSRKAPVEMLVIDHAEKTPTED